MAVPHSDFKQRTSEDYMGLLKGPPAGVMIDLKGALEGEKFNSGVSYWRL